VSRSAVIEYEGTFTFAAPVGQIWAAIGRFDRYPSWWSWLQHFDVDGNALAPGTVLRGVVVPPLPYRMRLDVIVDQVIAEQFVTAIVHGDLEGVASLTFERDGDRTQICARWTIEMMQPPMRVAARIAHPLLRWGHDRIVDATVDSFRRHLFDGQDGTTSRESGPRAG
jgi:polyketide cyclase/dehydrase/lipid transport protein